MGQIVTTFVQTRLEGERHGLATPAIVDALLREDRWLLARGWSYDVPLKVETPWSSALLEVEYGARNGVGDGPLLLWQLIDRHAPPADRLWVRVNDPGSRVDHLHHVMGELESAPTPCLYRHDAIRIRAATRPPGVWTEERLGFRAALPGRRRADNARYRLGQPHGLIDGVRAPAPALDVWHFPDALAGLETPLPLALQAFVEAQAQSLQLLWRERVVVHLERPDLEGPWRRYTMDDWDSVADADYRAWADAG